MDCQTVMNELESLGTAQNRKVYARYGVDENKFGVSYADLYKLQKKIKVDHDLAMQLWESGNHDARVLATLIADPLKTTDKLAESWMKEVSNYVLMEMLTKFLAKTPLAHKKAEKWHKAKVEWVSSAGWALLAQLALSDKSLPDDYFEPLLDQIEQTIHTSKNRVRYEMNGALIAIGLRNDKLEKRALAVAKSIGKVEVDHGQTGCKTPDAAEYIRKAQAYRDKKKAAKA